MLHIYLLIGHQIWPHKRNFFTISILGKWLWKPWRDFIIFQLAALRFFCQVCLKKFSNAHYIGGHCSRTTIHSLVFFFFIPTNKKDHHMQQKSGDLYTIIIKNQNVLPQCWHVIISNSHLRRLKNSVQH